MIISIGSWAVLSFALGVSSSSECVTDYLESSGAETIEKLQSIADLGAFRTRQVVHRIVRPPCDGKSDDELIALGVNNPENRLSVWSDAAYLSVKFGGSPAAFIKFLATDAAAFERAQELPLDRPNPSCGDDFLVLRIWLPRQGSGELSPRH